MDERIRQLREMLNVEQRSTIAKIKMITFDALEKCNSEKDIAIFYNVLMASIQQQAINRAMTVTDSYVEVVEQEKTENVNAV